MGQGYLGAAMLVNSGTCVVRHEPQMRVALYFAALHRLRSEPSVVPMRGEGQPVEHT